MADTDIAKAISILSKVSADTAARVQALEKAGGGAAAAATKGPRKVKEKAKEVIVSDFGRKAEKDLSKLGGGDEETIRDNERQKNQNGNLLKLLGLAGAAALALKFLFDGEGFTGLVQGFQNAFKIVGKQVARVKNSFKKITKRLGNFGKNIKNLASKARNLASKAASRVGKMATRVGSSLKNIGTKTAKFFKNIKGVNIRQSLDDVGKKLGTFMDDIGKGMSKAVSKLKGGPAAAASGSKTPPKKGFFSKIGSGLKAVGGKVASGAKAVGGKVASGAKAVGKFAKDKILAPLGKAIKKMKPLKLIKGLAKTPLLAPLLESFFMAGDINKLIAQSMMGELDEKQLNEQVGTRFIKGITGLIGGAGGAILGGALGSVVPVAGNIIGSIVGGVLGDVAGRAIGGLIAPVLGDKTSALGEWALSSPLFKRDGEFKMDMATAQKKAGGDQVTEITDGIITKDGELIKPHADDTLYAMKKGGPLVNMIMKGTNQQVKALHNLTKVNENLLKGQLELAQETNALLAQVVEKSGSSVVMNNVAKTNVSMPEQNLRRLQLDYSY